MREIKVLCDCGQKYKFDVEPFDGQMPFSVSCPVCAKDGTEKANIVLRTEMVTEPASVTTTAPTAPKLRLNTGVATASAPGVPPSIPPPPPAAAPRPIASAGRRPEGESPTNSNLLLGLVGALLGALIGSGIMFAFSYFTGFRFPLLGIGIGALTGFGSRLLGKGGDNTLGGIAGGIAAIAVVGTLYMIYGEFPILSIISVIVSISVSYRIASS